MDLNKNIAELADDALASYAVEVRAAFDAIAALEAPTEAQLTEAESYADHLDVIAAEQTKRTEAAAKLAARHEALRNRFAAGDPEPEAEAEEPEEEDGEDEAEEESAEVGTHTEVPPPGTEARATGVVALARKVQRPAKPATSRVPIVITAAADVPDFATGSRLEGLETVTTAVINRMRGFGAPTGDGMREDLRHVGVASFKLNFPKELTIDRHSDDMEVFSYAAKESRLPGGSLVAAGGWCAPSETVYDLCSGETTDGLISVPEINVARGGIKYTRGPDFSDIYNDSGFCQTEAQAIAGTAKTCITVSCPPFTEVRLDACGVCVKAPILTNAAYPELVQRFVSGAMTAHQHKMSIKVINAIIAGSTAKTADGLGAVATDTLDALTLYADVTREKYRLSMNASLEVVLPFWVKDVIKSDISRRQSIALEAVTDANVQAQFSGRNLNVQWVYGLDPLGEGATAWPADFQALMYPAGAWIKGTADVINLNAVYDAAELATNTYTALFFEQGILVAPQCYDSLKVTIPVCAAGRSGIDDLTCAVTP